MKSWAREFALGLLLATAIPTVAGAAAPSAVQILLDKANYWRLKDRPDLAIAALQQLLSLSPNEPEALYQYGMIEVQQGKIDQAKTYLARLQTAAPSSPRIAELENSIRAGQISPSQLSEARRLAQSGQFAQAAKQYEQSFRGPPPPGFGIEYYMTLAGTPQGWDQARRGLETLVQNSPNDSRARAALAEVLTYHSETRAQGIRMLAQLANDPVVGAQAARAWRQALMWLGGAPQDRQFYSQYLAKYPQDTAIQQHIAEAEKQGAGAPAGPEAVGYADMNRGNLAAAEREFEAQLRIAPGDANALAGLGLIRLRQQRFGEARELLGRAMREAPAQRGKWASAYESAGLWSEINEGKAAAAAGNYARAEQAYRHALAAQPGNSSALVGLYTALNAEGKTAEAESLSARVAALGPGRVAGANRTRADLLRSEGKNLEAHGDYAGAQSRFAEAVAVDPSDAWARLDYARFLLQRGASAQAAQIIDPAASGATAESFQAAAIFYSEQNNVAQALALLDRVPPAARTPDIIAFRERIAITGEIDRAKQLASGGNPGAARNLLMSLYSRPPSSPEKTRLIADALADIGDTADALQLGRPSAAAAARNPKATLDYAGLLFRAGRDAEAVAYLAEAERTGRITAADRRELEHVKIDIAARRADQLRTAGDIAGAYDQISPLLSAYPNDPTLLAAAGRIYAANGQNDIAMRFFDAAYRQSPGDINVIRAAVGGAIVAGDLARAQAYLAAGMRLYPNNPRLYYLAAQIARANGDNGAAVYDLALARRLDVRQNGGSGGLAPMSSTAPVAVPGTLPASSLPPNPFRQSQADPPPVMLAAATTTTAAAAAAPADDLAAESAGNSLPPAAPAPLENTATSADSADLVVPPRLGERPPRHPARTPAVAATAAAGTGSSDSAPEPVDPQPDPRRQLAMLSNAGDPDIGSGSDIAADPPLPTPPERGVSASPPGASAATQVAQLAPLGPPPIEGYQAQVPAGTYAPAGYYAAPAPVPAAAAPALAPLPPPPISGYQPPSIGQPAPVPANSLELDIERSMAAIASEAGPILQGGLGLRVREGESGLSQLTEINAPIEYLFSPFYTGTVRLQAIPTLLNAGTPSSNALLRFGSDPLLARGPGDTTTVLPGAGNQTASGVSFNAAYAYQMFSGEVGTTPLGFPVENLVGRIALQWPGPASVTTVLPTIPLAPPNASRPFQILVEGVRRPVTDSLLSYAGTRDPLTGSIWGGVVKTGGNVLASYDDGQIGVYGGGGYAVITGQNVADNSEIDAIAGAYVRPWRSTTGSLKVGVNLFYMGYSKNLEYFTFGQGGYFSPQNYVNLTVPVEYSGQSGRFSYLIGGALGVQTFNANSSPYFPTNSGRQAALEGTFGPAAFYSSTSVTGPAFNARGQVEYQLDNGFSVGGIASIDNAQNYTEGIAKIYLRKSFGVAPATAILPNPIAGSL